MEKLPMCRICLVEDVRMYIVVNRNLRELYEKLTDIPFVTEDIRPILACFLCCAKLKQCYQLLRKCLEAEELFAQMMNEDYEPNSLINQDHLEFFGGFIKSPIMHISIDVECQTGSIAIKEELPAVFEGLDDIIEPMEEHKCEELEPENYISPHQSEADLENDVPFMEFKTEEEEEQELPKKKRRARETKKLEQENLDNSCLDVADIQPHQSESDLEDDLILLKFKTEVEEEQELPKKKRRARETKRTTGAKKPKLDTRRTKLEDAMTADQTKKEKADSKVIRTTRKRTYKCKCDVCQRIFNHKCNLLRHMRIHTGEKPYKCDVCQRSFSNQSHLTTHIRKHTGEKPYKCDVCQYSFGNKSNLRQHILIHTGEKPYKCDVCQSSFRAKGNLTQHILIHTGEKPFKCDICPRSFRVKCNLRQHYSMQHTAENPFKCDICQCSFSGKNSLTRHIRIHTGENVCNTVIKKKKINRLQKNYNSKLL